MFLKAFLFVTACAISLKSNFILLLLVVPSLLYFSYVDFIYISFWNYLTVFITISFILKQKVYSRKYPEKNYLGYLYTGIAFLLLHLVFLQFNQKSLLDQLIFLLQYLTVFLLIFNVVGVLEDNRKWILFYYSFVFFVGLSSFVGFFQYFQHDWAWRLRDFFTDNSDVFMKTHLAERERISGLAYYNITLTYQLVAALPMGIASYFAEKKSYLKWSLVSAAGYVLFAILVSGSKSAMLGLMIGSLFFLPVILDKKIIPKTLLTLLLSRRFLYLSVLIIVFILGLVLYQDYNLELLTRSNSARLPLWVLGYLVYSLNPLGALGDYFNEVAKLTSFVIDWTGYEYFLKSYGHNQFVNTLTAYGIIGFSLLLLFYGIVIKRIVSILRSPDYSDKMKILVRGLLAYLVAYVVHSSFHNSGPFFRDVTHWMLLSLLFAVKKENVTLVKDE